MGERKQVGPWVDEDVWAAFKAFVVETHGQTRGHLGREVENALSEYIDRDRLTRVEENTREILARLDELDAAHTHASSETAAKVDRIASRLAASDRTAIDGDRVRRAIEAVAGADDRTVRKYREQLKRRGRAYEHPADDIADKPLSESAWTLEQSVWLRWAAKTIENSPSATTFDIIEPYPMDRPEFERLTTEVVA